MSDLNPPTKEHVPTKEIVLNDTNSHFESINKKQYQKLLFISNTLDNGWTVKKESNKYVFTKKHENKKEVYQERYLEEFILENNNSSLL